MPDESSRFVPLSPEERKRLSDATAGILGHRVVAYDAKFQIVGEHSTVESALRFSNVLYLRIKQPSGRIAFRKVRR
jgi:hypothetical protein